MNMTELAGCQRSENVNFEPIVRGPKNDILTGTMCKIRFMYVRFDCKRQEIVKTLTKQREEEKLINKRDI